MFNGPILPYFLQRMQVNDVFPHSWIKSRVLSRFIFHLASLTRFYDFLAAHPSLSFLLFGLIIDSRGGSCYWSFKVIQNHLFGAQSLLTVEGALVADPSKWFKTFGAQSTMLSSNDLLSLKGFLQKVDFSFPVLLVLNSHRKMALSSWSNIQGIRVNKRNDYHP